MTLVRTSPSGPNLDVGGGGDVSSVFARTGDVVAEPGDYATSQITNDSNVAGATASEALDLLRDVLSATVTRLDNLSTNDVANASSLSGAPLTAALDGLDSTEVANLSSVAGATVTAALDALVVALAGRLLGAAQRRVAGAQVIACPGGTRRVLVRMGGAGAGGGGGAFNASPLTKSGGGGGGAGAEQVFLYSSLTDIASVSVSCGTAGTGQLVTGGNGTATTVTINGEVFTSNPGEGGVVGTVAGAPLGAGGAGGRAGRFNFQTGSNFVLLVDNGGAPGGQGTGPNGALVNWFGGNGASSTFGGGGRGGGTSLGDNGEAGTGNCSGGGGGSSNSAAASGANGTPGAVALTFFS